jgi:hypothetical protein
LGCLPVLKESIESREVEEGKEEVSSSREIGDGFGMNRME